MKAAHAALLLGLQLWSRGVFADVELAKQRLARGDVQGAQAALENQSGGDATLISAQIQRRIGNYANAESLARKVLSDKNPNVAIAGAIELAETLRTLGRQPEARTLLEAKLQATPNEWGLQHQLGLLALETGDLKSAKAAFSEITRAFDQKTLRQDDSRHLFYLAEASRYLAKLDDNDGLFEDASEFYQEAASQKADLHVANLAVGYLFLEKFAPGPAQQSFDEVLKLDPKNPDAHAGLAALNLETSYDLADALRHLDLALATNPRHIPSLLVRISLAIDRNEWQRTIAAVQSVMAINPIHLEARSLLATVHWLRGDAAEFQKEASEILKVNPRYAALYHIVARSAVREHRYREAIELEKQAVAIDPQYYDAMEAIGSGYLRMGDEKLGMAWLRRAWQGDEFNVRTKNTLELFEKIIPQQYSFSSSAHFRVRLHNDEKALYRRYVEPFLERAFADMVERYGITLALPITVELYQNAEHYSVRTIGLPNLGALGVCFGQVITAISPSVGDINWEMVLWHELSHVFAIQLSASKVPRWFTEGLSEYETVRARQEWRRENDADVWAAMVDGSLPSVSELNYGFMDPSMEKVMIAYHLSSLTIQYIAENYGFDVIVRGLKLFGEGRSTTEVIEAITGKKVAGFDREFRGYLSKRMAVYQGSFHVPGDDDLSNLRELTLAVKRNPNDAKAHARLALGYFSDGNAAGARRSSRQALALDPHQPWALYVAAELAFRDGQLPRAKKLLASLILAGGDSFDSRIRLATIAQKQGELDAAKTHFCAAKILDPERSFPSSALADLYRQQGDLDAALSELEGYVKIEQMQLGPLRELVAGYTKKQNFDKVRLYAEMAVAINPTDADTLLSLGDAYLHSQAFSQALFTFESALEIKPQMRRPALAQVGRARALLGLAKKREAALAIKRALAIEPDNGEALALEQKSD